LGLFSVIEGEEADMRRLAVALLALLVAAGRASGSDLIALGRAKWDPTGGLLKAHRLRQTGDLAAAEQVLQNTLETLESGQYGDMPRAATLDLLGNLYITRGELARAEEVLEKALDLTKAADPFEEIVQMLALQNLAMVHYLRGNAAQAIRLLDRALAIAQRRLRPNSIDAAVVRATLAVALHQHGRYSAAEKHLLEAVRVFRDRLPEAELALLKALSSLLSLHILTGQRDKAARTEQELLLLIDSAKAGADSAVVFNEIGVLFFERKAYAEAERYFLRAMDSMRRGGNSEHPYLTPITGNLAAVYFRTGRLEEAERFYLEAIRRWELTHGGENPKEAPVLLAYAKLLKKTGRKKEAKQYEARAASILERSQSATELRSRVDVQDPRMEGWK